MYRVLQILIHASFLSGQYRTEPLPVSGSFAVKFQCGNISGKEFFFSSCKHFLYLMLHGLFCAASGLRQDRSEHYDIGCARIADLGSLIICGDLYDLNIRTAGSFRNYGAVDEDHAAGIDHGLELSQ